MNFFKIGMGLVLLGALVVVIQLADAPLDSPAAGYQRLPEVPLTTTAEAEWGAQRTESALLLLDYVIENNRADQAKAVDWREKIFKQLGADSSPVSRIKATGWAASTTAANSFESLAGSTVADSVSSGEIAELARAGALDANPDNFISDLNKISSMATVFPMAETTITLAKAARRADAFNAPLTHQLSQLLQPMLADPKSSSSIEKFKDNFMPLFELAKRCRTWGEFQTILQQADSPDQLKVLTRMISLTPASSKRLSQVLAMAGRDGRASTAACIDDIMRQGPKQLDSLYDSLDKGSAGLKFALDHPSFVIPAPGKIKNTAPSALDSLQDTYQALRVQYGALIPAFKYLTIAILCSLLVLVVVPGRYLEKLIARPGTAVAPPGAIHYFLSALAVGVVLACLAYLLSLTVQPAPDAAGLTTSTTTENGAPPGLSHGADNAFLSGTVVLISLVIHAIVWFIVRGKIRLVEDDEAATTELRLKRLENLDVFLDLPLFTGLALTVVAFILITLNAGMSRHFAYTSTVVGILSAVSLRIRYVYPLKERLIQAK
jgi:hypothetical protein